MKASYFLIVLILAGLISSCGRKAQRAMNREAKLPYEVSADRPILNKDIKIHTFFEAVEAHPPQKDKVPEKVERSADKELHSLKRNQKLSVLQKKINCELIYFHLLDIYFLPVYQNTGDAAVEEQILGSLVDLKDLKSTAELYLQARSLHAISQGGYYYPELQDYLAASIKRDDVKTDQSDVKEAKRLLLSLEEKSINK